MLDVHAPHAPVHSWREFFIHIATIVIGLCIAVGIEQIVEWIHHRHQIAETREALRVEREDNIRAFKDGVSEYRRQTAALRNNLIVLLYLQQHPGTPQTKLPGILIWHGTRIKFSDSACKTAQGSNVTALMPQEEVRHDSLLYQRIDAAYKSFDEIWPAIVQARLYSVVDPDPSHLTEPQVASEIELTKAVMTKHFTQAATLVQLGLADPGFTPAPTPEELNASMHISETEKNPDLAAAIAITNGRLPDDSQLPIPVATSPQSGPH
jgi:hypothetical protein